MFGIHFDQPHYGHLLWLVVILLAILILLELRRNLMLERFVSATMQSRLVQQLGVPYRILSVMLFCLALAFFVVGLMRPQYGRIVRSLPRMSAQIMICLDVSKSMLAEDVKPNRLERAKAEINDLLGMMDGDQVGITAFAGKATVACPMTTDFGFLRLILKDIGTHSAGLGGTKLAEPIRLATEGFGEGADISRIVLLITDGDDHESFPLEAAAEAAKRGVRIITVGFGDEAGSRIEITNARTGETDFIRDTNGEPVVSRLDGDLLRQLALDTNGVYIPAGTGALDLESIYREHIVPLTRSQLESSQEIVRNEAYHVPIAIGLILLCLSLSISGLWAPRLNHPIRWSPVAAIGIGLLLSFGDATTARAQNATPPENETATETRQSTPAETTDNPREVYNTAIKYLDTDLDQADEFLKSARNSAGSDGEVRFRSAFNLGWVEIKRADKLIESEPKVALTHLQAAIDWFNRAIRIRPKDQGARHNLEITMRRALELADSLRNTSDQTIEKRLDELIAQQRALQAEVGHIVELTESLVDVDVDGNQFREQLRELAVKQRQLLSDANAVLDDATTELQKLKDEAEVNKNNPQRSDINQRAAQLTFASDFLQQATQRMGQARSQLRRRQQERAYRRQAISLADLKRSRDVFREPAERIRSLLQDSVPLHMQTVAFANQSVVADSNSDEPSMTVPAWLTKELLVDLQKSLSDRTTEFAQQVAAGVAAMADQKQNDDNASSQPSDDEQQIWQAVSTNLSSAAKQFSDAHASLDTDQSQAANQQSQANDSLRSAEELLLDFRGLIERAYADQARIHAILAATAATLPESEFDELTKALSEFQTKNHARLPRITEQLEAELAKLDSPQTEPSDPNQPAPDPAKVEEEKTKYRKAIHLSERIDKNMLAIADAVQAAVFVEPANTATSNDTSNEESDVENVESAGKVQLFYSPAVETSQTTIEDLQALRRLFFTIVQRLKEVAQNQSNINDSTDELAGGKEFPMSVRGPLSTRQTENRVATEKIATELAEQAATTNSGTQAGPATAGEQSTNAQMAENYQKASELVAESGKDMTTSSLNLSSDNDFDFANTKKVQQSALQKLIEAIQLLEPPQDSEDENDQSQDQQQDQSEGQDEQQDQQEQQNNQSNSLLQMVRDNEAKRRDEKAKRVRASVPSDGRDW
ncbi:MAG: VWA domain-containing protein [Planctomycetales bacterium]|nr:VWA domain-containing protein [Planctomycetales bacterium]